MTAPRLNRVMQGCSRGRWPENIMHRPVRTVVNFVRSLFGRPQKRGYVGIKFRPGRVYTVEFTEEEYIAENIILRWIKSGLSLGHFGKAHGYFGVLPVFGNARFNGEAIQVFKIRLRKALRRALVFFPLGIKLDGKGNQAADNNARKGCKNRAVRAHKKTSGNGFGWRFYRYARARRRARLVSAHASIFTQTAKRIALCLVIILGSCLGWEW